MRPFASATALIERHRDLLFLAGILALLYIQLFALPATPYADVSVDGNVFFNDAARMLDGQTLYRDFFNLNFPGTSVLYYSIMKLFGVRAWISPAVVLLLGVALARVTLAFSRCLFSGYVAYLPSLLFITLSYGRSLDPTHHWFSVFLVLLGALVTVQPELSFAPALTGALCAVATWFTQTRGVLAVIAFALYLCWDHRHRGRCRRELFSRLMWLAGGFCAVLALLLCYYVVAAGPQKFLADTFVFPLTTYRKITYNSFEFFGRDLELPSWRVGPLGTFLQNAMLYLLTPGIYVLTYMRFVRVRATQPSRLQRPLVLALILGPVMYLGIAYSVSATRLAYDSFLGFLLLTWLCEQERMGRLLLIGIALLSTLWMFDSLRFHPSEVVELPSGRVRFLFDSRPDWVLWLKNNTKPGDVVFFQGGCPYYLLKLRNPSPVPYLTNSGFTRPADVRSAVDALERHRARYLLMDVGLDEVPHDLNVDYLHLLRWFVAKHYRFMRSYDSGVQLWQCIDNASCIQRKQVTPQALQ